MQTRVWEFQNRGREGPQGAISPLALLQALSAPALKDVFRAVPKKIQEGAFSCSRAAPVASHPADTVSGAMPPKCPRKGPQKKSFPEGLAFMHSSHV